MRQFQVPQFITVEDKVIGPFTVKQFLYLATGALLIAGANMLLARFFFFLVAIPIAAIAASLAFLKINSQSFPKVVKNAIMFIIRPRLYVWQKDKKPKTPKTNTPGTAPSINTIPKMSDSKLSDLAWSLDIKEKNE